MSAGVSYGALGGGVWVMIAGGLRRAILMVILQGHDPREACHASYEYKLSRHSYSMPFVHRSYRTMTPAYCSLRDQIDSHLF